MSLDSFVFEKEFVPWYEKILESFGFDPRKDEEARDFLNDLLVKVPHEQQFQKMVTFCKDRDLIFFGGGPSLANVAPPLLDVFNSSGNLRDQFLLAAADGAARVFLESAILPDIIFTDLDGLSPPQIQNFHAQGVFLVVHAHGDNIPRLEENIITLQNPGNPTSIIGTTQAEPLGSLINPGGFTDGDRGLCFLSHVMPAHSWYLVGMEFGTSVGRYSKPQFSEDHPAPPIKALKLDFGRQIVEWLVSTRNLDVSGIESQLDAQGIKPVPLKKFMELIVGSSS